MRRLRAPRAARLGVASLALIAAAVAGVAIGAFTHKPSAPGSSPVPLAAQSAPTGGSSSLDRARLRAAVTHLDGVRRPMRDRLARARTAAGRAKAAGAIAAAYRDAARTLEPDPAGRSVPTVALMRQLRREYVALAQAASANEAAAFASTGASIEGHERALGGALARWRAAA